MLHSVAELDREERKPMLGEEDRSRSIDLSQQTSVKEMSTLPGLQPRASSSGYVTTDHSPELQRRTNQTVTMASESSTENMYMESQV